MPHRFLYGPAYDQIQAEARQIAADFGTDTPNSVLWIEQNSFAASQLEDAWAADLDPSRLKITSLDGLVRDCYDAIDGPASVLSALTRRQLVEQGLRDVEEDGLLDDAHRHRSEVIELFSQLEGEGFDTTDSLRDLLDGASLPPATSAFIRESYDKFQRLLQQVTTRSEFTDSHAYRTVLSQPQIAQLLPSVDIAVVSGYYDLDTIQREFLGQLASDIPVIFTVPVVDAHEPTAGANAVARETFEFYHRIVDEAEGVVSEIPLTANPELSDIAGRLYTADLADQSVVPANNIRWIESPTAEREVRQVARSIRRRIANEDGITQDSVLVVVPGLISYREEIEDAFEAHGLTPVTVVNKLLYQTHVGRAMLDLMGLIRDEDATAETIAELVTNPMVTVEVDASAIARIARALPTTDIERLFDEVGADDEAVLSDLLDQATAVPLLEDDATIDGIRDLFELVGLPESIERLDRYGTAEFDAAMERRAFERVDRALRAIDRVANQRGGNESAPVIELVADELDQIRVPPPRQLTDGVTAVVGPREAFGSDYDHLYLVGMTAQDYPPDPERPRFFEAIYGGLDGVTPRDHRQVARYQFATMLASAETVRINTPEATANDEPLLVSPVVDELQRITGVEPEPDGLGSGYREDIQREIGRVLGVDAVDGVERAVDMGAFEGAMVSRVRRGVRCASQRASPSRTEHDGLLPASTVDALYPEAERDPYSPTRLNRYAKCGFRYALEEIIELEEPLEYALEPDQLDYGSLVHDVLELFYRELQDGSSDPVNLQEWPRPELERRLFRAGQQALDAADLRYEGAFFDRWLERLFGGLASPDTNPYYGPGADPEEPAHTAAPGLFAKFLDVERDRDRFAAPAWFEVGLDLNEENADPLTVVTPDGTVRVDGRIDRVAVDWDRDPPEGLVHDYKSSSRSPRLAVDGISFQLPLYALAASDVLADEGVSTPLDAAFYTLDHESIGDGWSLSYYLEREGDGTDADYTRLIESVTPERVGRLVKALEQGAYQPTVLDADTAGCRHCDFRDVCDVRYHARRDVIATMDDEARPGYVPRYGRDDSFLDSCGSDEE